MRVYVTSHDTEDALHLLFSPVPCPCTPLHLTPPLWPVPLQKEWLNGDVNKWGFVRFDVDGDTLTSSFILSETGKWDLYWLGRLQPTCSLKTVWQQL